MCLFLANKILLHDYGHATAILVRNQFPYMKNMLCYLIYCKLFVGEMLSLPGLVIAASSDKDQITC